MKSTYLTNRERLINALHGREVDRLPWSPLIDSYFINSLPLQNIHMGIIEAMRYIGNDIMERHVATPGEIYHKVDIRREDASDGRRFRIYYDTPVGSIYEERIKSGQTDYGFVSHSLITEIEDAKVYQYIVENIEYTEKIKEFIERDKYIGKDGIATASGPTSPIQKLLQETAGVENTVYLMADYPDEMDELMDAMHEGNKRKYKVLTDYPTEVVFDYEDTSSTVMSRSMYVNYSAPAIDDYAKIIQGSGKIFITHMCGCLNAFKEEIGKGIQNGIDSICPPDTGDLYIWEARKAWGDNKVLIGGIDPPQLSRMTVAQCEKTVLEIAEKMKGQRGFILSTGDAVPYGTPIENLIAVTKAIQSL